MLICKSLEYQLITNASFCLRVYLLWKVNSYAVKGKRKNISGLNTDVRRCKYLRASVEVIGFICSTLFDYIIILNMLICKSNAKGKIMWILYFGFRCLSNSLTC